MNERDTKPELPIHVILGASDYLKIKMQKCPRVGKMNEQIAKQTKMGWVIMSLGRESDLVRYIQEHRRVILTVCVI